MVADAAVAAGDQPESAGVAGIETLELFGYKLTIEEGNTGGSVKVGSGAAGEANARSLENDIND